MREFFNRLKKNSNENFSLQGVLFILLFYSLLVLKVYLSHSSFELKNFDGRFIGVAAFENIDIHARVTVFYKSVLLLLLCVTVAGLFLKYFSKNILSKNNFQFLNITSAAGCTLFYFQLIGADMTPTFLLLIALHISYLLILLSKYFSKKENEINPHHFAGAIILCCCFYFFFKEITVKYFATIQISLPVFFLICFSVISALSFLKVKRYFSINISADAGLQILKPLALLPALYFFSRELYMILNQHKIFSIHPHHLWFVGLIILCVWCVKIFLKLRKSEIVFDDNKTKQLIENFYLPWLLCGLLMFMFYQPIIEPSQEMFEHANTANAIQQFYWFGKIPFVYDFSSHALSDYFLGFCYTLLNGFHGLSFDCYGFLMWVFVYLVNYHLLKTILRNGYIAFFLLMFFPFTDFIIPPYYNIVLFSALALIACARNSSRLNFFILFSSVWFMMIWRADLGFANLLSLLCVFVVFFFFIRNGSQQFSFNRKNFTKGFIHSLIAPAVIFICCLIFYGKQIFISIADILSYLSSSQSFGNSALAFSFDQHYYFHYFIFPLLLVMATGIVIFRLGRKETADEKSLPLIIAFLFITGFYFFNFQRGLVRHTLNENWDTALSSFIFLLAGIFFLILFQQKSLLTKFVGFIFVSIIFISNYKFPQPEFTLNNRYFAFAQQMQKFTQPVAADTVIDRAPVDKKFADENFSALDGLMKNFSTGATFLDFSNSPMLYFYLHRTVPNFFCQPLNASNNDYLQDRFIEQLKKYDVPVVVFSNYPETWWDNADGVPNTTRHYKIGEYIFKNYEPFAVISKHFVWMKKNTSVKLFSSFQLMNEPVREQNLKLLPMIWGTFDKNFIEGKIKSEEKVFDSTKVILKNETEHFSIRQHDANYVLLKIKNHSEKPLEAMLAFGLNDTINGKFIFTLPPVSEMKNYLVRVSTQYNWWNRENNFISLSINDGEVELSDVELLKEE